MAVGTAGRFGGPLTDHKNHHQHIVSGQDSWILVWEWRTQDADISSPRCVFFYYLIFLLIIITG